MSSASEDHLVRIIGHRQYHLYGANAALVRWFESSPVARAVAARANVANETLVLSLGGEGPQECIPAATQATRAFWNAFPFLGPYPLLETLSQFEHDRMFYPGYRDHVGHQLKVFLLGLMAYDCCPYLSKYIDLSNSEFGGRTLGSEFFQLQWTVTALFHDIGYVLENEHADPPGPAWHATMRELEDLLDVPLSRSIGVEPATERQAAEEGRVFRRRIKAPGVLDQIEWGCQTIDPLMLLEEEALRAGLGSGDTEPLLRRYYSYAQQHKQVRPAFRDHGVTSALLLLFLWSSFRRYVRELLVTRPVILEQHRPLLENAVRDASQYEEAVRSAAGAIALHNITPADWEGLAEDLATKHLTMPQFRISLGDPKRRLPLAFLLGFVDTLQDWDRPRFRPPTPEDTRALTQQDYDLAAREGRLWISFPRDQRFIAPHREPDSDFSRKRQQLYAYLEPADVDELLGRNGTPESSPTRRPSGTSPPPKDLVVTLRKLVETANEHIVQQAADMLAKGRFVAIMAPTEFGASQCVRRIAQFCEERYRVRACHLPAPSIALTPNEWLHYVQSELERVLLRPRPSVGPASPWGLFLWLREAARELSRTGQYVAVTVDDVDRFSGTKLPFLTVLLEVFAQIGAARSTDPDLAAIGLAVAGGEELERILNNQSDAPHLSPFRAQPLELTGVEVKKGIPSAAAEVIAAVGGHPRLVEWAAARGGSTRGEPELELGFLRRQVERFGESPYREDLEHLLDNEPANWSLPRPALRWSGWIKKSRRSGYCWSGPVLQNVARRLLGR